MRMRTHDTAQELRPTHSTLVIFLTCPSRYRTGARVSSAQTSASPSGLPPAIQRPEGSNRANDAPEGSAASTAVGYALLLKGSKLALVIS